jgi:uncharacterized protein YndB with AHSA1/START domain
MATVAPGLDQLTLTITEEMLVRSSIEKAFEALLEQLGPANEGREGVPMPMTLEPWPGGRWFRDLGGKNGHLWAHVQAIKRPALLEFTGPLMISSAVVSNVQYRLKETDGGTLITLRHSALGFMPDGYREGLSVGWKAGLDRIRKQLEKA